MSLTFNGSASLRPRSGRALTINGYRREDGLVGVRNHLLILPTVICANRVATLIADGLKGAVAINHVYGCTFDPQQGQQIDQALTQFAKNPNVGAVIVVSLGCETSDAAGIADEIAQANKPVELLEIQEEGGTGKASERGIEIGKELWRKISSARREPCALSDLIVATECGGSDAFSGLSANPAVGIASDLVVENGGTVILSETTEIIGADHLLAERAVDQETREKLLQVVRRAERGCARTTPDASGVYITPGNIEGGLTTIEEKSLGCIHKAGSSPLVECVAYGQRPNRKGLVMMDTSGHDVVSVTGMVAGGAQMVLFTTGRGTPTGCAIAPAIKVASNTPLFEKMGDSMDINAGSIIDGTETIESAGRRIFDLLLEVASDKQTRSEHYGHAEFSLQTASSQDRVVRDRSCRLAE